MTTPRSNENAATPSDFIESLHSFAAFAESYKHEPARLDPQDLQAIADKFRDAAAACAKIADKHGWSMKDQRPSDYEQGARDMADKIASLIHARGEKGGENG